MTKNEAAEVLGFLIRPYISQWRRSYEDMGARKEWKKTFYNSALRDITPEQAYEIMTVLHAECLWLPKASEFNNVRRRLYPERRPFPDPEPGVVSMNLEQVKDWFGQLREKLGGRDERG